jgi:protein-disulfide isomerase
MGDRLRLVFRNFPLAQMHPHARQAAEAAEVAGSLGAFWEMHDTLYENQNALDADHLRSYAQAIGVDVERFSSEMRAHSAAGRVQEDFLSGIHSGVNGTPTFFINGRRYDGQFTVTSMLGAVINGEEP